MVTRRFVLLAVLLLLPGFAASADPEIHQLRAFEKEGKISVTFDLAGAFDLEQLNKALESGLPTGFTYHLELIRARPNWFDRHIDEATLEVVCSYDSRTREYLLNYRRNERLVRSDSFSDIEKLRQRMIAIDERDLFETAGYRPSKLEVRVRADIMRGYLLYVIPWDVSTPWSTTRVRSVK